MKNKDLMRILSDLPPDLEVSIQNLSNIAKPREILSVEKRTVCFRNEEDRNEEIILRFENYGD